MSHVERIAELAHARGIPLICDQAWAGHFGFHPDVPASALALGADAVAISTHKALTSFTPGAVLLARDSGYLDLDRLDAAFDVLETTSPSASLFASIDRTRALMEERGEELLTRALALAALARELIGAIDGVQMLDDGVLADPSVGARDPLKLIVDVSATLADGIAVDRSLNERGIRLEGADRRTLVPLLTIGDDEARVRRLATALAEAIDENRGGLREAPRIATSWRTLPEQRMTPRAGLLRPARARADRGCGRAGQRRARRALPAGHPGAGAGRGRRAPSSWPRCAARWQAERAWQECPIPPSRRCT